MSQIEIINQEINQEIGKEAVQRALIATTFKGFDVPMMKQALLEGMMRGFKFEDFLNKNVYAIKYASGYSLVTSIDFARKLGMKSGIVGKSAPTYVHKENGSVESCTVTVKRKVDDYVGEYTATVFFDEYTTHKNLWSTKPRTMIAKVAEMHALRSACPEELAKAYVEEELQKPSVQESAPVALQESAYEEFRVKLSVASNEEELRAIWASMPIEAKTALEAVKEEIKQKFAKGERAETSVVEDVQDITDPAQADRVVDYNEAPFPDTPTKRKPKITPHASN